MAALIAQRWRGRTTPFPDLLQLLLATYWHENGRRDQSHDGQLDLDDLVAFAAAYGHPILGIAANLDRMLAGLGLPPGRLPRAAFLTLVEQYWFDPSPEAHGSHLFDGVGLAEPGPEHPQGTISVS